MLLAYEATSLLLSRAIGFEAQSFDVGVSRGSILAVVTLDLADLYHLGEGIDSVARLRRGMKCFAILLIINRRPLFVNYFGRLKERSVVLQA